MRETAHPFPPDPKYIDGHTLGAAVDQSQRLESASLESARASPDRRDCVIAWVAVPRCEPGRFRLGEIRQSRLTIGRSLFTKSKALAVARQLPIAVSGCLRVDDRR